MSPKLLAHVLKHAEPITHPHASAIYPDLAALAMRVISLGAYSDAYWSYILVHLLGAHSTVALAMYEALQGAEGRRAAILGAAQEKLKKPDLLLFQAVYMATQSARKRRNEFAHRRWGFCNDVKDAFMLVNPKDTTRHMAHVGAVLRAARTASKKGSDFPPDALFTLIALDPQYADIYDRDALLEAVDEAQTACSTVKDLWVTLSQSHDALPCGKRD